MIEPCESCARWEQETFKSLFVACPLCGRSRDWQATQARNRKAEGKMPVLRVSNAEITQAILNIYDDYVLAHGANTKHVYFIVTYKAVAEKLKTTTYQVRKSLGVCAHPDMESILVEHGRGEFSFIESKYGQFRYFYGFDIDEYFDNADITDEEITNVA